MKTYRVINNERFYIYNYNGFCLTKERALRIKENILKRWNRVKILCQTRKIKFGDNFKGKDLTKFNLKVRLLKDNNNNYAVYTNMLTSHLITYINDMTEENYNKIWNYLTKDTK